VEGQVRGHLDVINPLLGIQGWALNLDSPNETLTVELQLGGAVLGTCTTGGHRDEISAILGDDVKPGFRFSDEIVDKLLEHSQGQRETKIRVGIAGTEFILPYLGVTPTVGEFVAQAVLTAPEQRVADFNLCIRLSTLRLAAMELAKRPLRPMPEHNMGCIEALSIDEGGFVWLMG
jgi:hypothetical protein